jgi:hypothetical protein
MTTASIHIAAHRNRTGDYTFTLFESDGLTPFLLQQSDDVRIKIGRGEAEPLLDLSSDDPDPSGSLITFTPNQNLVGLRLASGSTRPLEPGAYDLELVVVEGDESGIDSPAPRHVQYAVLFLHPTPGGAVGLEESSGSSSSS